MGVNNLEVFYDLGVHWAAANFASLRSFQRDRAALDRKIRDAFNWEGFTETVFRSSNVHHLYHRHQNLAEDHFAAGVCDAICGSV